MDEEEFQQSLEPFIKNPKKRKATEKKAGKEDAGHDVDASGKKKMKKMTAPRSPKYVGHKICSKRFYKRVTSTTEK